MIYKKTKLIFFTILFLAFFGLAKSSEAACSWNGNTGAAASTSRTDVAACITDAQSRSGDVTINIPAGSSSAWSSAISVNIGNGGKLSILGAGVNSTTINHTSDTLFSVAVNGGAQFFELGNIKTMSSSTSGGGAIVSISGTRENRPKFRIHNCEFNHAPYRVLSALKVYGLYDHNTDNDTQNQVIIVQGGMSDADQDASFIGDIGIGTANAVFAEDNTSNSTSYHQVAFLENEYGGRAVVRNNTVYDRGINTHGYHDLEGSNTRGSVFTELYDNYFECKTEVCSHGWTTIRGGAFYIWNNTVVEHSGKEWSMWLDGRGINIHYYGLCRKRCGTTADGSGECLTYPCSDQPGYYGTVPAPMYIWNNTFPANFFNFYNVGCDDGINCATTPSSAQQCSGGSDLQRCFIREGRDYFLSAPSNYTPYAYPHPLTLSGSGDTTPPSAPSGLSVR